MNKWAILSDTGKPCMIVDEALAKEMITKEPSLKAERIELDEQTNS